MIEMWKLEYDVKKILAKNEWRYYHSQRVRSEALKLAEVCGYDDHEAVEIAALLHDCSKGMDDSEQLEYINRCDERLVHIAHAVGHHPVCSALLAEYKFGFTDKNILNAIMYHSIPLPRATVLEKIIFVADFLDPKRYDREEYNIIRDASLVSLDIAYERALEKSMEFALKDKKPNDYTRFLNALLLAQ